MEIDTKDLIIVEMVQSLVQSGARDENDFEWLVEEFSALSCEELDELCKITPGLESFQWPIERNAAIISQQSPLATQSQSEAFLLLGKPFCGSDQLDTLDTLKKTTQMLLTTLQSDVPPELQAVKWQDGDPSDIKHLISPEAIALSLRMRVDNAKGPPNSSAFTAPMDDSEFRVLKQGLRAIRSNATRIPVDPRIAEALSPAALKNLKVFGFAKPLGPLTEFLNAVKLLLGTATNNIKKSFVKIFSGANGDVLHPNASNMSRKCMTLKGLTKEDEANYFKIIPVLAEVYTKVGFVTPDDLKLLPEVCVVWP